MEMVKKVLVSLIDDFDGKPADETVQFGLDGVSYEIDLSAENAKKLREHLQPWVNAGRRTGGSRRRRGVGTGGASIDRKQAPTSVIGHAEAVMRSPVGGGSGPRWSTLFGPPISAKFAAPISPGNYRFL